jgi:hypothetical protein
MKHHSAHSVEKIKIKWNHDPSGPHISIRQLDEYGIVITGWLRELFNVTDEEWPKFEEELFAMQSMPAIFELCLILKRAIDSGHSMESQREKFEKIFMLSMVR